MHIYLQSVQVQGGSDDCGMFVIAFQSLIVLVLINQVCCVHRKISEATSSIVYKGGKSNEMQSLRSDPIVLCLQTN